VATNSGRWNGGVSGVSVRLAEGRWTIELVVLGKVSDEERRMGYVRLAHGMRLHLRRAEVDPRIHQK